MEFDNLESAFPSEISRIGSDLLPRGLSNEGVFQQQQQVGHWSGVHRLVCHVLDEMGKASALAQGLHHVVTSAEKLRNSEGQVIYVLILRSRVAGILKVGRKNLFLLDASGRQNEVYPLCILDFYVHESLQRSGLGNKLFQAMLTDQGHMDPRLLAIDRPSPKLISFFAKHYHLQQNIPQVNHYHIFQGFFTDRPREEEDQRNKKRPRIYMGKLQYI